MAQHAAPEAPHTPKDEGRIAPLLTVSQPQKLQSILDSVDSMALVDRVSEKISEDRSGDWSGSGTGGATGQGDDDAAQQVSARELAIANLPEQTAMRQQLSSRIVDEVKALQKQVHREARRASKPGAGHRLTILYARIRRLNGLLAHLADAAYDALKRLYIRVVIDRQKVL